MVSGTGLENQPTQVSQVRILSLPPIRTNSRNLAIFSLQIVGSNFVKLFRLAIICQDFLHFIFLGLADR